MQRVIGFLSRTVFIILLCAVPVFADIPVCYTTTNTLVEDYTYLLGSTDFLDINGTVQANSTYRWLVNGLIVASGSTKELLLLSFNNTLIGGAGESPSSSYGIGYSSSRWGYALALSNPARLRYARQPNIDLQTGTIELWVALRAAGSDPVYTGRNHYLFFYTAPNGDYISITQSSTSGVIYAGGTVNGQWQSAYGNEASMSGWLADEWHHIVFTYSAAENFMRFYLDGRLLAENNEGHYWPPPATGSEFSIGCASWDSTAYYLIDSVRILGRPASHSEVAAWAKRQNEPAKNEAWLSTVALIPHDAVVFEFTPSDGNATGPSYLSDPVIYPGTQITDPNPPSMLLPPSTTDFNLSVTSIVPTECRYAVGLPLSFAQMTPFDSGSGTTSHLTTVTGLDPNTNHVNHVYIRSAADPNYMLDLKYRCLPVTNPEFPRVGNLWGCTEFIAKGLEYASKIDLWLGAWFNEDQIRQLRGLNPNTIVLTSINAVENQGLTEDYYLHDVNGNKVEVWPGSYRLNLTKPYVAEHQAAFAAQKIIDANLAFDGCFFDNVMTSQSWQDHDIYGNPFHPDSDEDGQPDDLAVFDAAWKQGVFHEIAEFRKLMPYALTSGHSMDIFEPCIPELFNAISIGFATADVIERKRDFLNLWEMYSAWHTDALTPHITMVESSPPDEIAYGYGYSPWNTVPPATLEFARSYYPYMRFGLAFTLMQDGFFAHEYGDTWHGNDWWYDELDFNLGYLLGPAEFIDVASTPPENVLPNYSFENPSTSPWGFWANSGAGCVAVFSRDGFTAAHGSASGRVDITATSGSDWHIELRQSNIQLRRGISYELTFSAKADTPRSITLCTNKQIPDWDWYGLSKAIDIGTDWQQYSATFIANADTNESRIQFMLGQATGTVWLDDVNFHLASPIAMQRRFTNGLAILNASHDNQTFNVGPGYRRITGSQAPLYDYIIDDTDTGFSASSDFNQLTYDTGEWTAIGPFYHNWGSTCRQSSTPGATASWRLRISQPDTYTITAWFPNAPDSNNRTSNALLEVVTDANIVLASASIDQSVGGDQWHLVAEVNLTPADDAFVRLTCTESKPTIADALHVCSAARYNDGSPAGTVTLQPMDGIILEWTGRYGDFNADGDIDLVDYAIFASHFHEIPASGSFDIAPLNPDGSIDLLDLKILTMNWLQHH